MPKFNYIAKYEDGDLVEGSVDAASHDDAIIELTKLGLVDIEFQDDAISNDSPVVVDQTEALVNGQLSSAEQIQVADVMRDVIDAGVPLAAGLASLAEEMPSKSMRGALRNMATQLEAGMSLEEIGAEANSPLPRYLVGLIKAGASAGNVSAGLDHFVSYSRERASQRQAMHATMLYGYFIGAFAILLGIFLFGWTIPQFGEIYLDFGMELPFITQSVLWIGDRVKWLLDHWKFVFPAAIVFFYVARFVLKGYVGEAKWRRLQYRIPVIGPMLENEANAEFCILLALQVRNQVQLPEALELTSESVRDRNMRDGAKLLSERAKTGEPLDRLASNLPHFSQGVVHALSWERKDGSLDDALRSVGELHAAQSKTAALSVQASLEPASVILIGLVAGYAIVALFMPLIQLLNALS
jgi:type II secretory pathway component PulF